MPGFCRLRMHTKGTHNICTTSTNSHSETTTSTLANNPSNNSNISYKKPGSSTDATSTSTSTSTSTNANSPVAFIEFKDSASAASAMQQLQGKYLLSSDRGSIRIEFAKNRMNNEPTMTIVSNKSKASAASINAPNGMIASQAQPAVAAPLYLFNPNNCIPTQQPVATSAAMFFNNSFMNTATPATAIATAAATTTSASCNPNLNNFNMNHNNNTNNLHLPAVNEVNLNLNQTIANAQVVPLQLQPQLQPQPPMPPMPPLQSSVTVVNSLQHQIHPNQHQNLHLFRDRSGYGIKA